MYFVQRVNKNSMCNVTEVCDLELRSVRDQQTIAEIYYNGIVYTQHQLNIHLVRADESLLKLKTENI